jgi:hypothetical protein
VTPRHQPDQLAAAARHWYLAHRGPRTPATRRVLEALADYYADTGFLEKALRFLNRPTPGQQLSLFAYADGSSR